jgi:hypothetical protein
MGLNGRTLFNTGGGRSLFQAIVFGIGHRYEGVGTRSMRVIDFATTATRWNNAPCCTFVI